jgi:hypothetical protein
MSWQVELPAILRVLINDLSDQQTYTDQRLIQTLTVAAKYVQFDINLDQAYQIDVVNQNISPDPTEANDDIFISLVCLKAACIVDQSEYRTKAAMEGIRAALGPASLAIAGQSAAWRSIIEHGSCASYDELTSHWDVKEATAIRAVLGPFVGNNFDPRNINYSYNNPRSRNFFS